MDPKEYLDFDLLLEKTATGYEARVLNSPAGPASHQFLPPFQPLEVDNFILRMSQSRQGMRRMESSQMVAAKEFGQHLFQTVFDNDVRVCLQSSLAVAEQQGRGLRIRLRLSEAQDLLNLPWEYLYDASANRFLTLSIDSPIVRYLDLPGRIEPLTVKPPLRVLVMISNPQGVLELDVEQEWTRLQESTADLVNRGLMILDRMDAATLGELQRRLRAEDYHILHFIGHGGYDEQDQDGLLILEDEKKQPRPVSGQTLGVILRDERTIRLAVLNACEGGRTSATDPFAGVGQSLLQQGVPAVIAMQFPISDEAAVTMAHEFYLAVAEGYPVDAALVEARKAIFARNNDVEWGTPVLYLRSDNGRIFDVSAVSSPTTLTTPQPATPQPTSPPPIAAPMAQIEPQPVAQTPVVPAVAAGSSGGSNRLWLGVGGALVLLVLVAAGIWFGFGRAPTAISQEGDAQMSPTTVVAVGGADSDPIKEVATAPDPTEAAGTTRTNSRDQALYVYIPGASYTLGLLAQQARNFYNLCQTTRSDCRADAYDFETPQHTVKLAGYWIMATEVTNDHYTLCVEVNACTPPANQEWRNPTYADHPVVNVTWLQADHYARWAGGRLPTEAEWEAAARGEAGRLYPWGDDAPDRTLLNFNNAYGETRSVGGFATGATSLGVLDLAGSVWEWTSSLYQPYPYDPADGREEVTLTGDRVIRGGSYVDDWINVRSTARGWYDPTAQNPTFGFRVVRSDLDE